MNKNIKICLVLTCSSLLAFGGFMYTGSYKKTQTDINELNFEINYITEQIRQNTVSLEQAETTLLDNTILTDFTSFPHGLLEQDQIDFYLKLGQKEEVELSGINMGTETIIGYVDSLEIMQKELSFVYKVHGYDEFLNFFNNIKTSTQYPASIETFSMSISDEDVVSGQMRLNQFYVANQDLSSNYEPDSNIEIGISKVFRNEQ